MNRLFDVYNSMMNEYGPQGWWPLNACKQLYDNNSNTKLCKGYHPGDYSYPENDEQRFEICIGAILTQNTAWINVEKALANLSANDMCNAEAIKNTDIEEIKKHIRPAGYYNQKSIYLKELAGFYLDLDDNIPSRDELLKVKGIGPETADSILLYAYNLPEFVVDAYTKRIFSVLGFFNIAEKYNNIKKIFENNIPKDVIVYQEFHALIVLHAKNNSGFVLQA